MIGPTEAKPIIPNVSSFVLDLDIVAETPSPSARINGTEISPVVAPLPSKAKAINCSGTKSTIVKIVR